ncbi:MAG: glycosyltransferase [Deltaproteobacteria bacterium]|nr:glycosyltransferase [Deltaproteobacteria bacterium]
MLVTNDYPPIVSGIGTYFYNLFRYQPTDRFFILSPRAKGCGDFDRKTGLPVIRRNISTGESKISKALKTAENIFYVFWYAVRLGTTKVHCGQILSNGVAGLLCKKLLGIPYVVWVYGSETVRFGDSRFLAAIMRRILASAELVVVISRATEAEFLRFGAAKEKVRMITPGVDTAFFQPRDKSPRLLEKYKLHDKLVLLTVARLDERKGHDMVINAISSLRGKHPEIIYLIVGKGREEQRLRRLVEDKGLREHVIFAGYVPDEELPDYYNLCDIFVLPNRETVDSAQKGDYEGFGIVFLEASSCEKPVIGGLSGGVEDAVADNVTGILVPPTSQKDILVAIKGLIEDVPKRTQMGIEGRRRAVNEFDWKIIAERLGSIL